MRSQWSHPSSSSCQARTQQRSQRTTPCHLRGRRLTSDELVEEGKRKAVKAWHKVLPFGAQVLASAAAYSVGITATQVRR